MIIRNDKIPCLLRFICESCFSVAYMYVCVVNYHNKGAVHKYILITNITVRYMQLEITGVYEMSTRSFVPTNWNACCFILYFWTNMWNILSKYRVGLGPT